MNNGIEEGSIITSINDVKIKTVDDAEKIIKNRNRCRKNHGQY